MVPEGVHPPAGDVPAGAGSERPATRPGPRRSGVSQVTARQRSGRSRLQLTDGASRGQRDLETVETSVSPGPRSRLRPLRSDAEGRTAAETGQAGRRAL